MAGAAQRPRARGLTLIELAVVMAIVFGLLALIVGVSAYARRSSFESRVHAALSRLENALQEYMLEFGAFPETGPLDATSVTNWLPTRFKLVDPWGNPYQYKRETSYSYELYSTGPDGLTGTADDIVAGK